MNEPIETVIIKNQQEFDLHDVLNPVQTKINNDQILNMLKKHKKVYYKLTSLGFLFPSSVTNDTKQIFVTWRELNNAKTTFINGKIYNILGIINLNKINNWEYIKGKSLWVNIDFDEANQINNNSKHLLTSSLNDLLNFSINLIDDDETIELIISETKIGILNFKINVFLK